MPSPENLDLDQLEKDLLSKGQRGLLLLTPAANYAAPINGTPGLVLLDLATEEAGRVLHESEILLDPQNRYNLRPTAHHMVDSGVKKKIEGDLHTAYALYRLALYLSCHDPNIENSLVMFRNAWLLSESVRDLLERGRSGLNPKPFKSPEGKAFIAKYKQDLELSQRLIAADGARLIDLTRPRVTDFDDSRVASREGLKVLRTLKYATALGAGASERRDLVTKVLAASRSLGDWGLALLTLVEEFPHFDMMDVMVANQLLSEADLDSLSEEDQQAATSFAGGWQHYLQLRSQLADLVNTDDFVQSGEISFNHFGYLRQKGASAGGVFGHRSSYLLSRYLQVLGRDLVQVLSVSGLPEEALIVAERTQSRAMVDWMGRTHRHFRLPPEFIGPLAPIGGSINGVNPADLQEIKHAAAQAGAPLLIYMTHNNGTSSLWLISTDGRLTSNVIRTPSEQMDLLFHELPYATRVEDVGRSAYATAREIRDVPHGATNLKAILKSLYLALFPEPIRLALQQETSPRLVLIADRGLELVPFCALVTEEDRYLIEDRELIYWPSITAWLTAQSAPTADGFLSGNYVYDIRRDVIFAGVAEGDPEVDDLPPGARGLAVGKSQFPDSVKVKVRNEWREVTFVNLPGVEREIELVSRLVGVPSAFGDEAVRSRILKCPFGLPILHIATHGILAQEQPEQSCLVLSDGVLTARDLYEYDRGVRVHLVVLSACQTALGGSHSDSIVGLTNAFIIAGCKSVVSTLWSIPDAATVQLMEKFYSSLDQGQPLSSCLRHAQLALLANSSTRHPRHWASFRLTGRNENPFMDDVRLASKDDFWGGRPLPSVSNGTTTEDR